MKIEIGVSSSFKRAFKKRIINDNALERNCFGERWKHSAEILTSLL